MTPPPHREKDGLRGPVRRARTEVASFETHMGRSVEKPWYRTTAFYDEEGWATEKITHYDGGPESRTIYTYSAPGRLAESRDEVNGGLKVRTVYLYDSEGRLSYELSLRPDGIEDRQTRRFYEPDGGYTEEYTIAEQAEPKEGACANFIRTRRDAADRPLEMRFYEANGTLLHRFVYHYNEQGLLTDMEQRTGDTPLLELPPEGMLAGSPLAEFAALGSPDAALSTVRYRHDGQGRRVEAATWIGARCTDRRVFHYDERGEKIAERRYLDTKLVTDIVYQREYDERGNWLREAEWDRRELLQIARRTIDYA